jgi:hypothetical protein
MTLDRLLPLREECRSTACCRFDEAPHGPVGFERVGGKRPGREIGRRPRYYPAASGREDAILMGRQL